MNLLTSIEQTIASNNSETALKAHHFMPIDPYAIAPNPNNPATTAGEKSAEEAVENLCRRNIIVPGK
ncbi:MAG: hypothetical protein Q4A71_07675 [Actinomycetaceae bacterium]|nr:hypothetical protein [Actinomycetaceae bacterium]